jgi:hypothetical protein
MLCKAWSHVKQLLSSASKYRLHKKLLWTQEGASVGLALVIHVLLK